MNREEELKRDGWEKRATYDDPRLTEMVEMYEELGFEVLLEPLDPASGGDCGECMKDQPDRFKTVYTRRR